MRQRRPGGTRRRTGGWARCSFSLHWESGRWGHEALILWHPSRRRGRRPPSPAPAPRHALGTPLPCCPRSEPVCSPDKGRPWRWAGTLPPCREHGTQRSSLGNRQCLCLLRTYPVFWAREPQGWSLPPGWSQTGAAEPRACSGAWRGPRRRAGIASPLPQALGGLRERSAQPGSGHWSGLPKPQCS